MEPFELNYQGGSFAWDPNKKKPGSNRQYLNTSPGFSDMHKEPNVKFVKLSIKDENKLVKTKKRIE
jgi:hypothetical protein